MCFAILLDRENDDEEFECKVTINDTGDWKTELAGLVGSTPRDDPIPFDPTLPPTNKLRKVYDIENLGSLDLNDPTHVNHSYGFFLGGKSDESQRGILGTLVDFLRNTAKSDMSESGSASGSSSDDEVPSRRSSMQHQDENEVEHIDSTDIRESQMENTRKGAGNEALDSDIVLPTEAEMKDEVLHLVWQDSPVDSDTSDQATEARPIDFIVIPGVYGNWTDEDFGLSPGSGSSAWVTKFAEEGWEKPKNPQSSCRVFRFEYYSSELFSGHRSREAIHRVALRLLNGLRSKRSGETKKRLIYFISHDIGGTIVKDALITASLDWSSWQDISETTRVLIFNGCPHRQRDTADLQTRLASFLYSNYSQDSGKPRPPRPSAASISGLTIAIIQVNGLFATSHIALRSWIINLHSYGENSNGGFDAYCATLGIPLERRLIAPTETDYSPLTQYLAKIEPEIWEPKEALGVRQYTQERKLLALASPIYPLRNKVEPNPLADLPDYQAWFNSPCPQILYLHGSHRVRDVAESVFYALEDEATRVKRRANVLYFSFDRFDVRADSIRDMIATFLAQICNHHPRLGPAINRLCSQIENEKGWTETDLIQFFEMFRISAEVEQTMIVINHFDECSQGSRKRFLDHITDKYYNDETPWKIVVTSHEPDALSEELSGPFCVPIDISSEKLGDLAVDSFETDIQALISSRGDLSFREEQIRTELGFTEKLDPAVRHILFEQLRVRDEWPDEISTDDTLGLLGLSKQVKEGKNAMIYVLNAVLKKYPNPDSLECLLSWLLYAVRPLTIWELATIISFPDERECTKVFPSFMVVDRLVEMIEKDFAGILEVDHNEVRFKHPCFHEIMVSGDPSSKNVEVKDCLWNKITGKAHHLIQSMCLDYLSRDAVQEYVRDTFTVADSATFETPPFPDRTNLASYAIQAWAHHSSLSSPLPDISAFSSKKDLVQTLAKAQWCLSNPATRRSPCFQSLFPIFAGLGLSNVVEPLGSDDALRGLIEAASQGQKQVVEDLIGEYDFTPDETWEVLKAASSSGSEELMKALLDKIEAKGKIPDDFEWSPVLIYRAANLGLEGFTERILSLGCPTDPDVDWRNETSMQASPLYQAAYHGYINTVRVLLKHGASMEYTSLAGRNPLHEAALEGHTETVKAILEESQVNIDCPSESNFTPLYLAVLGGSHDTVKLLLEKGADPNMGISDSDNSDDQWTPLHAATDDGFMKCIRLLLDNGANPNIPGPSGPPLHWAVAHARIDVLDMLLKAGADPQSEALKKPLLVTSVGSELKEAGLSVLKSLLELKSDVNCKDDEGSTPLITLIRSYENKPADECMQRDKALGMLIDHGADVSLPDNGMWTPLQYAVMVNYGNAVQMLLEAGADPNLTFKENRAPLCSALHYPKLVRLLLEKGANPDVGFDKGFTPLTYVAYFGFTDTAELLLEFGGSVDLEYGLGVEDPLNDWVKGWTPLMCATHYGYGGIVRMLAEAGADMRRRDKEAGRSIVHLAIFGGTLSTILEFPSRIDINATADNGLGVLHYHDLQLTDLKRLVNAGADIEIGAGERLTPLQVYADSDFEKVRYIVKRGANVNALSPHHGSPLHQACRAGRFDIIKLLVEHGANVNVTEDFLGTPLQALFLAWNPIDALEHEKAVRYLLSGHESAHADVTIKAGVWGYAINSAAFGSLPSVINLILDQERAKVNAEDDMGRMPIHFAACNGLANFEAILERGGDIYAKDKQGRTPLHWAAQTGRLQVMKKIISLMGDKLDIDAPDIDGWTPLCWAPRNGLTLLKPENAGEPSLSADVVGLLIEYGAKIDVIVKQGEDTWTPLSIAYYHGSDPDVLSLLDSSVPTEQDNNEDTAAGTETKVKAITKKGVELENACCDYCLSRIYGLSWGCQTCKWFWLCDKCYRQADILHPIHSDFTQTGEEEYEKGEHEVSATNTSGSSDTFSNSGSDSDSGSNHSEAGKDNKNSS
ncbi:ankyrin 1 [Fusarium phyllophilum]|uniref:Ankyrin 1 n=1 Tax=Fusarium phyllophilum TaxID=47803 RepID=A0A8H5K5I5_9HYPO|nr:ankyrin 1 [Fusarium phyllophilum]